ncbi:MAG TPA: ATP-binding protein, partial [Gammaproteobacteria bacterium]|nr:ATP-binding protein [Gammaproteobacteria bacterium]
RQRCDPDSLSFETTADLEDLTDIIGQDRAREAVKFGVDIPHQGYNLYVMGPSGMGKHTMVHHFLEKRSAEQGTPPDLCYVNNFEEPHKPWALRLPPGRGVELRHDMENLVEELASAIPAAFESDEYRTRMQAIEDEIKEQQERAFNELNEEAEQHDIKLYRTPSGFAFAPQKDGEVLGPEEFQKLSKEEQQRVEEVVSNLQEKLQKIIQQIPQWRKSGREKAKAINREITEAVLQNPFQALEEKYEDIEGIADYLEAVRKNIIEHVDDFMPSDGQESQLPGQMSKPAPTELHRYKVNVLVDNSKTEGAPVIYDDHPTFQNLVGRTEHTAQYGTLMTDFTLIKPGSLHQARGGYLIVDAHKLLIQPYAWEALKRSLFANEIRVESLEKMLSLVSTVSVEPQPIPLDTKVIILGDRRIYYLLYQLDPEFPELFKVNADFEERIDRNDDSNALYGRMIGTLARKEGLRAFDKAAVARVVDHGARLVEDGEKLSTHMRSIADLLHEADYWAGTNGRDVVGSEDIQKAIDTQIHRASRVKERLYEEIQRETLLIDTRGEATGQVNGLSVLAMGNFAFGQPSRITATVHLGDGDVVDIERESDLGGSLHSKGVMILSSFLAARYATKMPLSVSASLVFEQNYGMVDGDSASLAELCSLLSAIGQVPIRQSLAMTGSVNQHGKVQPIGGVNEKVEGFFDVCNGRGLTGEQGVLIPVSNTKHLMLRDDIVDAAREGRFHLYPVATVD